MQATKPSPRDHYAGSRLGDGVDIGEDGSVQLEGLQLVTVVVPGEMGVGVGQTYACELGYY